MATIAMMPIFSSDHLSERVRGMCALSHAGVTRLLRQKRLNIWIVRRAQLVRRTFEQDQAVLQHHELGFFELLRARLDEPDLALLLDGFLRGDKKSVPKLVRDEYRCYVLEIAQLDDLLVYGVRRDRIEPGRRLV